MKLFEFDIHIGDWRVLIQSRDIQNGAVQSRHIADGAVTTEKLDNKSVTTEKMADGAVTSEKLADGAIKSVNIKDGSIAGSKLKDNSIGSEKLKNGCVTTEKLANESVTSEKIVDGSVTNEKLANKSVSTENIVNGAVTEQKLANESVTEQKLANGSVTTQKLVDKSVTEQKLASGSVTTQKLANGSVTGIKLANGSVTNDKILNGSVTNEKLQDKTITREKLADGAIQNIDAIVADVIEAKEETEAATEEARKATADAQETADHPDYVGEDNYVWRWDKELKDYVRTDIYLKGDQGNSGVHFDDPSDIDIVNNLTDGGAEKVLSAEMGRVLHQRLNQNEVAIDMGDEGDLFVYLYDYSQVMDAEMNEDGDITLTMVYDPEAVPGCSPVIHVVDGGSGHPEPSSVGSDEIKDGSIRNEDLSDEVKNDLFTDDKRVTQEELDNFEV